MLKPPPKPVRAQRISDLDRIIMGIPGYDPWADAGDCTFDAVLAKQKLHFFSRELVHVKGKWAKQPFVLEEWQQAIIANLFGWIRPDGKRRYREAFIYVPRKNGKTCLTAGILLCLLFEDGEPGAEIYGAASEYKQAALVFEHARGMVRANSRLLYQAKVLDGQAKEIRLHEDGSAYRVISGEHGSTWGFNTHAYVLDELHVQDSGALWEALQTGVGAREQPLAIAITTADYLRESICNEKYDYARKVRDEVISDPAFLPVIYEAPQDADWTDPQVWAKANPNLGVSLFPEYLERECKRAKESPAFENAFKRLHLNIRTETDERLISAEMWQCGDGAAKLEAWEGKQCVAALDLGATSDLTSLCLLFNDEEMYRAFWWHWMPRESAEHRERKFRIPYSVWAHDGWLTLTDGNEIDYRFVRADINRIGERFGIICLAADRLFQGAQLCQDLVDDGFDVRAFGQGFMSMAAPTVEFLRLLKRGDLKHGNNPLVRWQASNVMAQMDAAGNIKPDKQKSGNKIDAIVTAVMAVGLAVSADGRSKESVYATRGLLSI